MTTGKEFWPLIWVLAAGAIGVGIKLVFIGVLPYNSDFVNYQQTALYLLGDTHAAWVPQVLLKPLEPLVVAALGSFMGVAGGFTAQMIAFYFGLIVAAYLLAKEFFEDAKTAAVFGITLALAYPVLKYGLDLYIETGALFFYVLSLWLTVKFLKHPSREVVLWNAAVITLGFLWKEYSIVSGAVFGLAILFHPALALKEKVKALAWYVGIFAVVSGAWQLFFFLHYHYTYLTWYHQGGAPGYVSEWTLKNLIKSFAALLGLWWLMVPLGLTRWARLKSTQKLFLTLALWPPFVALLWGYVSSRLFFVVAPPLLLLALFGIDSYKNKTLLYLCAAVAVIANVSWLFFSYAITL